MVYGVEWACIPFVVLLDIGFGLCRHVSKQCVYKTALTLYDEYAKKLSARVLTYFVLFSQADDLTFHFPHLNT